MNNTVLLSLFLFLSFRTLADDVVPEDKIYSDKIKSILFYPQPDGSIGNPIVSITQSAPLVLEFDEINGEPQYYYFKIYHYNADWKQSYLSTNQYLSDFNEFRVTDREMSFKTRVPYYHYSVTLPKVKVSGNYLIKVYRNYNEDDVIFTRRFVVFEPLAPISADIMRSNVPADAFTKQQVNFQINYSQTPVANLYTDVKVVLRQNYRWDNTIQNLRPAFIKDYEKILDYQFYNNENAFNGGNEFRFFDMRSVLFNGMYMDRVERSNELSQAWIMQEGSRQGVAYTYFDDLNGAFYPQLYETQNATNEPDYILVHFNLKSPQQAPGDVYIYGAFNLWKVSPQYQLTYDEIGKCYTGAFFMKQGYYNYRYTVINAGRRDDLYFEGNSSLAENAYDIIVYARIQGEMYDRVIGYYAKRYRGR